jgi:hypothetical protein
MNREIAVIQTSLLAYGPAGRQGKSRSLVLTACYLFGAFILTNFAGTLGD